MVLPMTNNRIVTTTRFKLMPFVVDTVLNSNVYCTRALGSAKRWSGNQMKFPIKYTTNSTGISFSGFDTFSTSSSDTRVNLVYDPAFYQITVALPMDELSVNATEDQIMDLMALEMKSSAQDMADSLGNIFYQDGLANNSKDPLGLGAIVDDGTRVATIGGLSRATYPTLKATVTASGGTLSLAKMESLYNAITSGSQRPTCGFTTPSIFSYYGQLLQPQERIAKDVAMIKQRGRYDKEGTGFTSGTGFTGLYFKGFPILADEKASQFSTSATPLLFLNEDYIDWYALPMFGTEAVKYKSVDIKGNDYSEVLGLGFSWSGWIKPSNQAALIGHVYLGGNLLCDNPKRQGVLTGITGI